MSADIIQKIFANPAAAADSVAAVDVPNDGFIESIYYNIRGIGMDALNDVIRFELSFASANTFTNNDSRISILDISMSQQLLTSGGGVTEPTGFVTGINIPVFAGERIHVHYTVTGGPTQGIAVFYLYYSVRGRAPARRTQRRR